MRQPVMTPRGGSHRGGRVISNAVSQVNTLSLVAAFDELCRNGSVLQEHSETQFVSHIRSAVECRKRLKSSEAERGRLTTLLIEKDKELAGKDYQIRQARKFVEEEVSNSLFNVRYLYRNCFDVAELNNCAVQ